MRYKEWKEAFGEPEEPEDVTAQEEWEDHETRLEAWRARRAIRQPEPGPSKPPAQSSMDGKEDVRQNPEYSSGHDPVNLRKEFGKVQIIVKLANIHLTPEKPEYEGGSWHVEGQANEAMSAFLPTYQ